jgi:RimJ/RimL family protein N-acetyltransferase
MAISNVIETPRLRIEPYSAARLTERYVRWLNDPLLMRYSEHRHRSHTIESCRDYMRSFEGTPNYFWAVVAHDENLGHIGNMNAYVDTLHSVADVGILIAEASARGQGFATEAWLGGCDYLLRVAGIRKVTAGTIEPNAAMLKVMERSGMAEDGRRIRHYLWNGQEVDIIYAALFRTDWLQNYPEGPFAGIVR